MAIKAVRHIGVVGECNIQYALNPDSKEVSVSLWQVYRVGESTLWDPVCCVLL